MRSIRLSLIVYFLALLALALGGVSWFAYQTTAKALRDKQASTESLINAQYEEQCKALKDALDTRILNQAHALAGLARNCKEHFEPFLPLGVLGTPLQPQGFLNAPLWLASGWQRDSRQGPTLPQEIYRKRDFDIVVVNADDIVPIFDPDKDQAQEYFQIYNKSGHTQQRSEKMGNRSFHLDESFRDAALLFQEDFKSIEGGKLRMVTFKASVPRTRFTSSWPFDWGMLYTGPKIDLKIFAKGEAKGQKGEGKGPKSGRPQFPSRMGPADTAYPVVFIQYASETSIMDGKLTELLATRDEQLAEQQEGAHEALLALRMRVLWISLATFAGIVAGGFLVIRLGLAPLAHLSDAVSKVSEKDFSLKVNPHELPSELQPIAARLAGTLDQLKQAFAREKQAAADISHELRTPLAAMMATMDLALRKSRTAAEYRDLLSDIRSSGDQMTHLVERLLALARLDAGADRLRTQEVDARDVARQCTSMIRPLAEAHGLALTLHAPDPAMLKTDADKLREILNNLLHNAIEYNRPEGAIDLDVARVNGHVRLEVRDTGIGITPEQRAHIFERFFRADPSRHADTPHAGLGLAIVKSYVDLMGGTIGVASGAKGSTFTVELPAL